METALTLLIADRNPHVRNFLQREFTEARYRVHTAESAHVVLSHVYGADSPDMVIIDPDLPDTKGETLLSDLLDRVPRLPIIIHTLRTDDFAHMIQNGVFLVEKQGCSIEQIKQIITAVQRRVAGTKISSAR